MKMLTAIFSTSFADCEKNDSSGNSTPPNMALSSDPLVGTVGGGDYVFRSGAAKIQTGNGKTYLAIMLANETLADPCNDMGSMDIRKVNITAPVAEGEYSDSNQNQVAFVFQMQEEKGPTIMYDFASTFHLKINSVTATQVQGQVAASADLKDKPGYHSEVNGTFTVSICQ